MIEVGKPIPYRRVARHGDRVGRRGGGDRRRSGWASRGGARARDRQGAERRALALPVPLADRDRGRGSLRPGVPPPASRSGRCREELLASAIAARRRRGPDPYTSLHQALAPGATGFLQYSFVGTTAVPTTPLSSVVPAWTTVPSMISIDQTSVSYQPDPTDPSTQDVLPKVWDFTALQTGNPRLPHVQHDARRHGRGDTCLQSCSVKNQTAAPARRILAGLPEDRHVQPERVGPDARHLPAQRQRHRAPIPRSTSPTSPSTS